MYTYIYIYIYIYIYDFIGVVPRRRHRAALAGRRLGGNVKRYHTCHILPFQIYKSTNL